MNRGVLLVHGAWHTGMAWDGVAGELRARGVPVAVAELHRGSLAADIAAAETALDQLRTFGPVVACGHSYGGAVITGLPQDKIAHLVYLAAVMPDVGETSLGLLGSAPPTDLHASMIVDRQPIATIDRAMAPTLFYAQLSARHQAVRVTGLVPQDMSAGYEPTTSAAWHTRPSTYVVCTEDRALHPDLQRRLSTRAGHTLTWRSDHCAFASHQGETVALLGRLAADV